MKTQAAFIRKTGSPEVIEWGDFELPELRDNEILVKVEAAAVDHIDAYIRAGKFKMANLPMPLILGRDMVGVVEKVGKGVRRFKPGQKVWSSSGEEPNRQGYTAERIVLEETYTYPVPSGVDPIELVAILHSASTACRGLIQAAMLRSNEIIFVNGGAGNVGSAVIQLAVARGASVAVATTGQEKMEWCKSLGAEWVFDYEKEDVAKKVRDAIPEGVQVFWDTSRKPHFDLAVKVLAPRGRIILMAGGEEPVPFPVRAFFGNEMSMKGFTLFAATPEELAGYAEIINRCMVEKKLKAKIAKTLSFSETAKAHEILEKDSKLWGKLVLKP